MSATVTISAPGAFTESARMSIWWTLILLASHIGWFVHSFVGRSRKYYTFYTIFLINLTHTEQIHKAVPYNRMALHFKQRGHHVSAGPLATPRVCLRGTTASSTALLLAPHRLCNSDAASTSAHVSFLKLLHKCYFIPEILHMWVFDYGDSKSEVSFSIWGA